MGHQSQEYSSIDAHSKREFDEAEARAFEHVQKTLGNMPGCGLEDLRQAGYSYAVQSFASSGIPVREIYLRAKAERWAVWWFRKHRDRRTPRPHTKYTPAQALRGRQVAAIRKKGRADWLSLRAQLLRDRGAKLSAIAGELGCTVRTVSRLTKRQFPKLVLAILGQALNLTHGKSSVVATSDIQAIDSKEQLRRGRVPADPRPAGEQIDEIDRLGATIPDLLLGWWAAQGL